MPDMKLRLIADEDGDMRAFEADDLRMEGTQYGAKTGDELMFDILDRFPGGTEFILEITEVQRP